VSKHHAALVPAEGGWSIEDLGSTNCVFVNGKQVQHVALKHGDRVKIGPYELFFETKGVADEWVPSYLMDMSTKVHDPTILQTKPPQKGYDS
jgi:pSer/pThr/pTyr-binding forkhead associated (FHA) protein